MDSLGRLIAVEHELNEVDDALCRFAEKLGSSQVGALHVTCSDETEAEVASAFNRYFVAKLLPELKPGSRAPFRTTNLGGRYEWGSVRVAEEHVTNAQARQGVKLVVTKINAHAGVVEEGTGVEFGWVDRYGETSACCGALRGMLEGSALPAVLELGEALSYDGLDRRAQLASHRVVPSELCGLYAAVASARIQADRAVRDIGEYRPASPTIFLVLPCVTLNRPGRDTELVVGQYGVDRTQRRPKVRYVGLGDHPADYHFEYRQGRVILTDSNWPPAPEPVA